MDTHDREFIIIGDRILISPENDKERTQSGLYLPQGVAQKDKVQCGYVAKIGPGYILPHHEPDGEPWESSTNEPNSPVPSPSASLRLARTRSPATRTRPASIQRRACARETPERSATSVSTRTPTPSGSTSNSSFSTVPAPSADPDPGSSSVTRRSARGVATGWSVAT